MPDGNGRQIRQIRTLGGSIPSGQVIECISYALKTSLVFTLQVLRFAYHILENFLLFTMDVTHVQLNHT